tara:strand:+ start:518 stop:637 length:120 start_codon:yes stop_codon:yes gene_type:complete
MLKMVKVKDVVFFLPKLIIDDFLNLDKLNITICQSSSAG